MTPKAIAPIHIMFVLPGLFRGGAETVLVRLIEELEPLLFRTTVVSLRSGGAVAMDLQKAGAQVVEMGLSRDGFQKLWTLLRWDRPDFIQGWMYVGNLIAVILGILFKVPSGMSIHACLNWVSLGSVRTALVVLLGGLLSRFCKVVLFCSNLSLRQHRILGYRGAHCEFLPNFFDPDLYQRLPSEKEEMRRALGFDSDHVIIGWVGRNHDIKDPVTFLRAVLHVLSLYPSARVVMVGRGIDAGHQELTRLISDREFSDRILLLGERQDVPALLSCFDLFANSSLSEAFPMVIGEAMAAGLPCVGTDVGDTQYLIGETGFVVPPRSVDQIAEVVGNLVSDEALRAKLSGEARDRIEKVFSRKVVGRRYEELFLSVVNASRSFCK